METLTIVFTGLLIFQPQGVVNIVDDSGHLRSVSVKGGITVTDFKKIAIQGVTASMVKSPSNFQLPNLVKMFTPTTGALAVYKAAVVELKLPGGELTPVPDSALCRYDKDGSSEVSYTGVVWKIEIPASGLTILVDSTPITVKKSASVTVSNNYRNASATSHLHLYEKALVGTVKYDGATCEELPLSPWARSAAAPKSVSPRDSVGKGAARGQLQRTSTDPITCPPVYLQ